MNVHSFGQHDGAPVFEATIASKAGATAKILTWGAVLRDLVVPLGQGMQRVTARPQFDRGLRRPFALLRRGAGALRQPHRQRPFHARRRVYIRSRASRAKSIRCMAGPTASAAGCGSSVRSTRRRRRSNSNSPDGDQGFPGALRATCVYRLLEPATLRVELTATCDRPTIVNLTQHAYFNLDGSSDVRDHELALLSDFYTPSDDELIPTGEIRSVAGTPFDFRQPRPIRNPSGQLYDANFVAARTPDASGSRADRARCARRSTA